MSFGKTSNLLTWILIALIPIGAGAGIFIGWAVFSGDQGVSVTITVKGSTTVEPIILATVDHFEITHPGVTIEGSFAGSGTGITALMDGEADVAVSSRPVKSTENDTAFTTHSEYLRAYAIAKDGLAVITHIDATTNFDLTVDEIKSIFNGTITSWDDPLLSGNGLTGNILVIARDSASGTRGSFDDLVMGDDDYADDFQEKTSNADVVTEIGTNPQAIGYCGLAYLDSTVKTVFVDGVEPTKETVLDGNYDISRDLYVVTLGYPGVDTMIWEYVQWLFSPTAQGFVDSIGYIAVQTKRDDLT
jgi:phosphate transport system substrate-binding protein